MSEDPPQTPQAHTKAATVHAKLSDSIEIQVVRGLNDTRLAILGIIVTIALTVAFGVQEIPWWQRLILGVGVFGAVTTGVHLMLKSERATDRMMGFAHWVLGRKH